MGILFCIILLIFSETSITIPIGANNNNITAKVDKYFLRMYLSIMLILSGLGSWVLGLGKIITLYLEPKTYLQSLAHIAHHHFFPSSKISG